MSYTEDVNVRMNVLAGAMGGITAIASGMSALTSTFGEFGTQATEQFGSVSGLLVSASAMLSVFAYQSAQAFGEFEQGMKIVQTVSGQSAGAINELGQQANQLSVEYRTAIGDITEGLQTLGRAGLNSAESQIDVLKTGLQTAKLEGRNLNSVLEEIIQNTAMLGGDLKSSNFGEQAEYLNSLMVGTSMTAPITSHDISQTLQYSGGTMAAAGGTVDSAKGKAIIEDYMGTVASFAQKGVTGSMAGTALRAFFTKPASQDESVMKAFDSLNLNPEDLWTDGGNTMKKVSEQIEIIQQHMDSLNLSTMEQVELWGKIVGPKMGQQMMKLHASDIKELTSDIQQAQSAEALATKTLDTYNQKVAEMGEQGQLAFREFGSKVAVILKPIIELISGFLSLLSNPVISTAAFGVFLATIGRGIRAAWSMITSLYATIKALISDIITGIQNITGTVSGELNSSVSTVGNNILSNTSKMDLYNERLKESNALLAQHQAQMLGLKNPGFMLPGGSTSDKIDRNIVQSWSKNYIPGGVASIGSDGDFFEPGEAKQLANDIDIEKNKLIRQAIEETGKTPERFIDHIENGKTYAQAKGYLVRSNDPEFKGNAAMQFPINDKEIKDALKNGMKEMRMDWKVMTKDQFAAYKEQMKIGAAANPNSLEGYTYQRIMDLERDAPHIFNMKSERGGEYALAPTYTPLKRRTAEFENIQQIGRRAQDFIDIKDEVNAQMDAKIMGQQQSFWKKMQTDGQQYMGNLSKTTQSLSNSFTRLGVQIPGMASRLEPQLRTMAMQGMQNINAEVGIGAREIFFEISNATSLTGKELYNLVMSSEDVRAAFIKMAMLGQEEGLTTQEKIAAVQEEIDAIFGEIAARNKITEAEVKELMSKEQNTVAEEANTASKEQNTVANEANTVSEEKNSVTNALSGGVNGIVGTVKNIGSGLSGVLSGFVGMMGGPFMAATMGLTVAMQVYSSIQQNYQKTLKEALDKITEATEKQTKAEEAVTEEYTKSHKNATELDKENALLDAYAKSYDSIRSNGDKLDENTAALRRSTSAYKIAVDASTQSITEDTLFGLKDGLVTKATNDFDDIMGQLSTPFNISGYGGRLTNDSDYKEKDWFNINNGWGGGVEYEMGETGYFDYQNVVLTPSQSGDDYPWLKEFSPILAADIWTYGIEGGINKALGDDNKKILDMLKSTTGRSDYSGSALGSQASNIDEYFKSNADQNRLQMGLKTYKDDFIKLGYEMRKYEKSSGGRSALRSYQKGAGMQNDVKKGYAKIQSTSKRDTTRLINYIKTLSIKTGMDEQRVLMAAQLQQLQVMQEIGNEVVRPEMLNQTAVALEMAQRQMGIQNGLGMASSGAIMAGENARAIAAFLQVEMESKITQGSKQFAIDSGAPGAAGMTDSEVYARARDAFNAKQSGNPLYDKKWSDVGEYWFRSYANANAGLFGRTGESQEKYTESVMNSVKSGRKSWNEVINTFRNGAQNALAQSIQDQYDLQAEQATESNRGSGGGSSGSGDSGKSSDKDYDKNYNRKERVDLVLCNKKEIPKLNVNLFKKPPNFTVLNKNFKLRDIKINSQDKPKAIMNAVKNGIIETQKRMDPKIIQDDKADYNPVDATEGSSTPSGTTRTTT